MIVRIQLPESAWAGLKRIAKARRYFTTPEIVAQEVIEQYVRDCDALDARFTEARRVVERGLRSLDEYERTGSCEITSVVPHD